jgi:hypothetical protein
MKSKRTYYGYQLCMPYYPGEMDYVGTHKPGNATQVKCRAYNTDEAREILNQMWADTCEQAMKDNE